MKIHPYGWIFLLICLCASSVSASAQSGLKARLSTPDASAFPIIRAYLDLHDADGNFIQDLQPEQLSILEEGSSLPVQQIEQLRPGVQAVVAINPGPAFAIRNFQAVSRYDMVKNALRTWAKSRLGTTTDDWSLLITGGSVVSHTSEPARFLESLDADPLDPRDAQPSIDTLARAIALASDSTPRPGMSRMVLFITSAIDGEIEAAVRDIMDQAQQQDITIHIWMVASSGALSSQSVQKLLTLADGTGGSVFNFSGEETLPNPEDYLEALRPIYRIQYQSKVGLSGEHEFSVQIQSEGETIQTNPLTFQVNVQPPKPAFVSPPILIERSLPRLPENSNALALPEGDDPGDFLFPKEIDLQVVFDFPDGRKREIIQTALLVDGAVIDTNETPPFDQFTWNLDPYSNDAVHQLQVQVTDELGLTGTSIEVPVQISVEKLESDPWFVLRRNLVTIVIILAILAGGFVFLVLVLGGKLHPVAQLSARRWQKPDRVSRPVVDYTESQGKRISGWVSRLHRPNPVGASNALAYLYRVSDADQDITGPPIPITSTETRLGSDPNQANLLLEESCIEGVHAYLIQKADQCFWLSDQGSVAGTWVNFTQVTNEEVRLQHGDLVHFGRIGFRFTVRQPVQVLKPSIALDSQPEPEPNQEETEDSAP